MKNPKIDHEKLTRMAAAARTVAERIESGALVPGQFKLFQPDLKDVFADEGYGGKTKPCCAMGHVLDVFGCHGRLRMGAKQAVAIALGLVDEEDDVGHAIDAIYALRFPIRHHIDSVIGNNDDRVMPDTAASLRNLALALDTLKALSVEAAP